MHIYFTENMYIYFAEDVQKGCNPSPIDGNWRAINRRCIVKRSTNWPDNYAIAVKKRVDESGSKAPWFARES